ncbi:DUF4424 domain-containing protein [Salmonella enterica subsp. enterica serovar Ituri]|nr:DUF4424 domain-containing protein [Salmonella enterica subsp. enterica serovar Ituri]
MRRIKFLFTLMLFSAAVGANDTWWGDDNGSIQFLQQNDISMAKERLLISVDRINVDYLFVNHGSQDITLPVAFPMPVITQDSLIDGKAPGISNFQLSVNGKPVATESRWKVMRTDEKGKSVEDITLKIKKAGWTTDRLIDVLQSFNHQPKLPPQWFKNGKPLFTLQQYFVWQQVFPAGKEVVVHHAYTPSLSGGLPMTVDDFIPRADHLADQPWSSDDKCLSDATLRQLRALEKGAGKFSFAPMAGSIGWTRLGYILTTGANWKDGTIGDFTLRIHKQQPGDILSLCFNHPLMQIDPLTLEFKQQNFKPENDLSMTFYYAPEERSH